MARPPPPSQRAGIGRRTAKPPRRGKPEGFDGIRVPARGVGTGGPRLKSGAGARPPVT
jgi:hypothetical protein